MTTKGTCKLCGNFGELQYSHIIPEFLYKPLYDKIHRAIQFRHRNVLNKSYLQKGVRDWILCKSCESRVNDNIEKPFRAFWTERILKCDIRNNVIIISGNHDVIKKFILLNLWRASVSNHDIGENAKLGPHEKRIRDIITGNSMAKETDYPLWGNLLVDEKGVIQVQLITKFARSRPDGHTVFYSAYGGVEWCVKCSSHKWPKCEAIKLKADGTLILGRQLAWTSNVIKGFFDSANTQLKRIVPRHGR
jgi:hypothetical protein